MNWGTLFDPSRPLTTEAKKYEARVIKLAKTATGKKFTAIPRIISEGKIPTDPGVKQSRVATADIPMLLKLAFCARATNPAQAKACRQAAAQGLLEWARVYKPMGNPINENNLIPWIQAWDMLNPLLQDEERKPLETFARELIAAGDKFYGGIKISDSRYSNNWASWRLCLRGLASAALNDETLIKSTQEMVREHISRNILPDGSTIDFQQRDALLYHVYDLEALILLMIHMPEGFLSPTSRTSIEKAVGFMEPFFTGKKIHIEFANSKVPFDIKRRTTGLTDYQNAPWKPEKARKALRLARTVFPKIISWTNSVVDERYDPMLKLEVAAFENKTAQL